MIFCISLEELKECELWEFKIPAVLNSRKRIKYGDKISIFKADVYIETDFVEEAVNFVKLVLNRKCNIIIGDFSDDAEITKIYEYDYYDYKYNHTSIISDATMKIITEELLSRK